MDHFCLLPRPWQSCCQKTFPYKRSQSTSWTDNKKATGKTAVTFSTQSINNADEIREKRISVSAAWASFLAARVNEFNRYVPSEESDWTRLQISFYLYMVFVKKEKEKRNILNETLNVCVIVDFRCWTSLQQLHCNLRRYISILFICV